MNSFFKNSVLALSFSTGLATASVSAQAAEAPTGLYCSCGFTTSATGQGSVHNDIAALDFVDGVLVRVMWDDINPAEGVYNWDFIDNQLARAEAANKKVALAIMNGSNVPDWVLDAGAASIDYYKKGVTAETMPLAWDPIYLEKWTQVVADFGARYNHHPTISVVHMTNATSNGLEMQITLSGDAVDAYYDLGYSVDNMSASYKAVIDAYAAAFPDTALDVEVHDIFRDPSVAQNVAAYGKDVIGERFGIFGAWWTLHNATNAYPEMYDILAGAETDGHYGTVQFARAFDELSTADYIGTIDLAFSSGVRYMEVWERDLLDPSARQILVDLSEQLRTAVAEEAEVIEEPVEEPIEEPVDEEVEETPEEGQGGWGRGRWRR